MKNRMRRATRHRHADNQKCDGHHTFDCRHADAEWHASSDFSYVGHDLALLCRAVCSSIRLRLLPDVLDQDRLSFQGAATSPTDFIEEKAASSDSNSRCSNSLSRTSDFC